MYIPGGRNVVNNRDLLVLRSAKRMRDGACIYLWRSVAHPKYPPKPDVLRAEAILAGFLVLPNEDRFTSTLISISMLDPKGKVSATAVQSLNMMQARLPLRFAQYMRDVEQLHIERPLPSHIRPPFFVPTCYSYNGSWNPCPEAPVLGQHGPNNNNVNDTVKKEEEEQENNSNGAQQRERKGSKKSCPISAHISFMEAESVLVLSKGPINVSSSASSSSSSTVKHWIGYHNGKRGLFDVDYVRLSDAASPVVAALSTSSNSPLKHTSEEENRGTISPSVNYTPFIELITRPNLTILSTICNHADPSVAERSALAFLQLLKITPGRTIPLLITLIANEVRKTNLIESSTLFRGHNIASHLLSAYCQLVGRHYLHKMVQPLVEKVLAFYSQGKSIEVDPARLGPHDNPHGNLQRLNEICSSFVPTTLSSLRFCPNTFRVICYHLQREVEKKFPDSRYIVLGGFFFLRFISPAIVSPEAFGVLDALGKKPEDITPDVRRGLVLVSKVIQNLANGVEFGEKEEHMTQLNSFIRSNIPEMERFFEEIASFFPDVEPEEQLSTEDVRPFARYLHAVVCDHLTDIVLKFEQLERSSSPSSTSSSSSASPVGNRIMEKNGQSTFETLIQVLLGAGPAPPVDEKDINLEIALHGCYSSSFPLSSSSLSPSTSKKSKFLSIKGKKSRKSSGSGIATGIAVGGSGGASGSGGGGSVIGGRVRGGVPNFERPVRKGKPRMFYGTISGAISHASSFSSSSSSSTSSSASSTNVSSSQETQQGLRSSDGSVATRGGPSIKELRSTFEAQSVHSSTSPSSLSFGKRPTVNNRPKGGSTTRPFAHSLWENGEIHRSSPPSSASPPNHNTDPFLPPPNNISLSSPSSPSSSHSSSSPIETRRRSATSPNVHIINHNKKKEKALNVQEDSRSQTWLTTSEKETKQKQKEQRKNKARFRSESFSMGDGRSNPLGSDGEESPSAMHQNASSPKRILRRFTFKDGNKRKEKHETLSKADSAEDREALHQALAKLQERKKQAQRDIEQLLLDSLTTAAANTNSTLRTKATKLEELRILLRVMEGHVCAIERLESRLNLPRSQHQASGSLKEFLSSSSPSSATSPRKWRGGSPSPAFVPANKAALPLRQQGSQQMEQSSSLENESTATSAGEEQSPSASGTTTELPPQPSTGSQVEDASAPSGIAIGRVRPRSKSLWTAATTPPFSTTTLASPSSAEAAAMERRSSPSSPSPARRGTGGFTSSTMRTKSLDHGHSYNPNLLF
ncbi:Ras GTPase activating protein ira2 [Balamuthia mandrillaris]